MMNADELAEHVDAILRASFIRNRIVVLCEGDTTHLSGRRSPQNYRRMGAFPDANFYKACVPRWWGRQFRPEFINCGDRKDVIDTYFALRAAHKRNPQNSHLAVDKLFALVDLDIQLSPINAPHDDPYPHASTEAIFADLYQRGRVARARAPAHRIWVTGLIHKEAYFMLPSAQRQYDTNPTAPFFQGSRANLQKAIYPQMAAGLASQIDLCAHYSAVRTRIAFHEQLQSDDVSELSERWQVAYESEDNDRDSLAHALLTLCKCKPYWNQFIPDPAGEWTPSPWIFREQLSLRIADSIAQLGPESPHHIASLFAILAAQNTSPAG